MTTDMIQIEIQRDKKQNTLSFLWRKRECIKMLDSDSKSGAKVASFNENGKEWGYNLIQFNNLKSPSAHRCKSRF